MYYQTRVRTDKPFPVKDDYFKPVSLSQQRLSELRAEATDALKYALSECGKYQSSRGTYLAGNKPWRLHAEHDGLTEYKRPHKTKPTASESVLFGTTDGNYLDFIRFFKSETREDYYNVQKAVFPFTIDAAVLHNINKDDESSRASYEGIKWAAFEPFSMRFRLDSVHYECIGTGVDADCRPFAYRVVIPTADLVPDLFKAKRSVRTYAKSVTLAMPSERNGSFTELFMTMENDFKSNHVPRSFYKRYMMSLHKIGSGAASSRKATRFVLTPSHDWAPANPRGECAVCARSFSVLRSKHGCAVCSEVVCRKCAIKGVDVPDLVHHHSESSSSRFCKPCVKVLRDEQAGSLFDTAVLGASSEDGSPQRKTPSLQKPSPHHMRLSETPTEVSAGEASSSYGSSYRSSHNSASHRSSQPEWVTTPKSRSQKRSRFGSDQSSAKSYMLYEADTSRHSRSSSASSSSSHVSMSPEEIAGENKVLRENELIIYEEEEPAESTRSVLYTIDTSEMERVRSSQASPASSASSVFENISNSLQEQEILLRQLHLHASAGRSRQNTSTMDGRTSFDHAAF